MIAPQLLLRFSTREGGSLNSGHAISATVRSTKGSKHMRVYLTAPGGVDVSLLTTVVRDLNWGVFGPGPGAAAVLASPRESILQADAVIVAGGASDTRDLSAVMLEAGIAIGLGKPLLLIWDEIAPLPYDLVPGYRISHISLRNAEAIRFHVGLFLAGAKEGAPEPRPRRRPVEPSAADVTKLSERLSDLQAQHAATEDFGKWIEDVFRTIGSKTVPSSDAGDRGFDLVVGAPVGSDLEGPVLVEAKTYWPAPQQLQSLVKRLDTVVASQQASRGIVAVLARENSPAETLWSWSSPRVAVLGADDLLRRVTRQTTLFELFAPRDAAKRLRR